MSIDEIVSRAIPLTMSCKLDRQRAERRRDELKKNIEAYINNGSQFNHNQCTMGTERSDRPEVF